METLPLFSPGDNDWAVAGEIFENQIFANQETSSGTLLLYCFKGGAHRPPVNLAGVNDA
jgi:hypothetical protein